MMNGPSGPQPSEEPGPEALPPDPRQILKESIRERARLEEAIEGNRRQILALQAEIEADTARQSAVERAIAEAKAVLRQEGMDPDELERRFMEEDLPVDPAPDGVEAAFDLAPSEDR